MGESIPSPKCPQYRERGIFAELPIQLSFFWKNAANSVKTLSLTVQMRKLQVSERFHVNVSGFLVTVFALVF